mgnify:CR=1 FL=1
MIEPTVPSKVYISELYAISKKKHVYRTGEQESIVSTVTESDDESDEVSCINTYRKLY